MTSTEMVTDFKLEGATVQQLLRAVNEHLKHCGIEAEDRDFGVSLACDTDWRDRKETLLPSHKDYRWLVAFTIEGNSEGYYIHIGAMKWGRLPENPNVYTDFGHAKTYSADQAYQIAREAQRFLTAAAWN